MSEQSYSAPAKCPVCNRDLTITKLSCASCGSEIIGQFGQNKFSLLSEKDVRFIEVFVRCRGNIKDVERELGVSYPTVRSMLDHVIEQINLIEGRQTSRQATQSKAEILDMLENEQITPEEAIQLIKGLGGKENG